ncbi:hypothetical protein [Saccharospirillum salsuginis]|uniref:Uncharacterized protein n=1 Tax=Saccharospirillum salsuginis TaxID=418750 RepID=A0A918K8V5_9GAMM|nr:hypothetical protein [Saccharospirillum salsuginis]GGX54326.1 hypothetical protein GCM10007392_22070 [Saccharospirillum salsuginis]
MRTLTILTLLFSLWIPATFAESTPYGPEVEEAYRYYLAGTEGDKKATGNAVSMLETLRDEHPEDPLILTLLGGSQTLQGRDAWMPWNKMSLTEDGLAAMGKAQRLLRPEHDEWRFDSLPVSLQVKSLAGITFTQVPDFFGRFEQGYALLLESSQSPLLDEVAPEVHSYIHYYAALAAKQAEEKDRQIQLLQRLAALPVDDDFTTAARDALAEAGE